MESGEIGISLLDDERAEGQTEAYVVDGVRLGSV